MGPDLCVGTFGAFGGGVRARLFEIFLRFFFFCF